MIFEPKSSASTKQQRAYLKDCLRQQGYFKYCQNTFLISVITCLFFLYLADHLCPSKIFMLVGFELRIFGGRRDRSTNAPQPLLKVWIAPYNSLRRGHFWASCNVEKTRCLLLPHAILSLCVILTSSFPLIRFVTLQPSNGFAIKEPKYISPIN